MGSHRQILRSSALVGGSSFVSVLLGMVRVKFAAVYLGPLGVGLMGAYVSILGPVSTLAGFGLGNSAVREVADAVGANDQERVNRTIITVNRISLLLGLGGMLLLLVLAYPICLWTFGTTVGSISLAILSVTILIGSLATAQTAMLQGTRRIGDLARQNIYGGIIGTIVAVPMMIGWGQRSIVPMMLAVSASAALASWHYARRIATARAQTPWTDTRQIGLPLLKFGAILMSTSLMTTGVAYVTRVIIIRQLGLDANGLYTSAWSISTYCVGFILSAMGADFYPRLTAAAHDHAKVNRLVNEQTEIGLLLAIPVLIGTLTMAPLVIHIFYSAQFAGAVDVLRWQVLGLALRVVSWPLAFILLAKGEKRLFFGIELLANVASLACLWPAICRFRLAGAGLAFFALYTCSIIMYYLASRKVTDFTWSKANLRLLSLATVILVLLLILVAFLSVLWSAVLGVIATGALAFYSMKELGRLTGSNIVLTLIAKIRNIAA